MIKKYYQLMKPGIILGNAITAAGGFALAAKGSLQLSLLLATLLGLSLIVASACVFNNYIDRIADAKMARTKHRALARGVISKQSALLFASILCLLGMTTLALYPPVLSLWMALGGFFFYVAIYSFWKYRTSYGTELGSIAGALPPLVGYSAANPELDAGAWILFSIVAFWQMPHFHAIAICRIKDYATASIPVLPVRKGMSATKIHMLVYIIAFTFAAGMLTFQGYTGYTYLIVSTILGLVWLALCFQGFKVANDQLWARQMFRFSLVVITTLSLMISVNSFI